ncbi:MAG: D-alanyl-D-alanine carboxypeptidase family protein [Paracoccaceae bacterium]
MLIINFLKYVIIQKKKIILNYLYIFFLILIFASTVKGSSAFEFATYVIDARTGDFLYGKNYLKKLHPASLTKMMTLYLTFNELKNNRIKLDELVTISSNASIEPPSKLGLKKGQKVSVRNLLRGAAIRSANDAATALGEFISGSENKFSDYMTLTAIEMGMKDTTFQNAHGLTSSKHLSTPKDMAILARRLIYDFPEYYNLFGRTSVNVIGRTLYNTNRKFLSLYSGSDGIKTGFTSAAGFNLAASAKRGNKRVIGIVFGSSSVALRNKRMTELLDIGFSNSKKVVVLNSLKKLHLYPNMINKSGRNTLLQLSREPIKRPKFMNDITSNKENIFSNQINELILEVNNSSDQTYTTVEFSKKPLFRPFAMIQTRDDKKYIEMISIMVGFYYNKYNAEQDLPSILLNDSSLTDKVNAQIIKDIYMKKQGFRIKISPLSRKSSLRVCEKIKASGELCEISNN